MNKQNMDVLRHFDGYLGDLTWYTNQIIKSDYFCVSAHNKQSPGILYMIETETHK